MNVLLDRTTSTHPLSIGTSMMLESIVKGNRPAYDDAVIKENDYSKYQVFSINVYTLCRNILSSVKSDQLNFVKAQDLQAVLLSEISYMADTLKGLFNTVEFYYCQYSHVAKKHPNAKLLTDNTDKQKQITSLIVDAVSRIIDSQKGLANNDAERIILYKDNYEAQQDKNILLFTSQPYNLLALGKSTRSSLIESHTAHIKSRPLWYTKLHTAKQEPWMAFNHVTLQLFGDGNIFQPFSKYHREYFIDIGKRFEWKADTTLDRMRLGLSFDRENPMRHDILDLF